MSGCEYVNWIGYGMRFVTWVGNERWKENFEWLGSECDFTFLGHLIKKSSVSMSKTSSKEIAGVKAIAENSGRVSWCERGRVPSVSSSSSSFSADAWNG